MYLTSKYELSTPCTILEVWSFNVLLDEICVSVKLLQSCPTLCDPMDCSFPGSSVHGILQARIVEWVAMPSSRGSSQPRDRTHVPYVPCTGSGFFTTGAT